MKRKRIIWVGPDRGSGRGGLTAIESTHGRESLVRVETVADASPYLAHERPIMVLDAAACSDWARTAEVLQTSAAHGVFIVWSADPEDPALDRSLVAGFDGVGYGDTPDWPHILRWAQARAAARQRMNAEGLYRSFFERTPMPAAVLDDRGHIIAVNPAFVRSIGYLGIGPEERPLLSLLVHKPGSVDERSFAEVLAGYADRHRAEVCLVLQDGSQRWVDLNLFSAGGAERPRYRFAVLEDITARKLADASLREREEGFQAAFMHSGVGMSVVLTTEPWVHVNPALQRMLGLPPQISSERLVELTLPEDRLKDVEPFHEMIAGLRDSYEIEKRYVHPQTGEILWCLLTVSLERTESGDPHRVFGTVMEITERKRAEEELIRAKEAAEASSRAKSDFLASMSHELRTPLNSVIGFANVLRQNKGGNLREQDLSYLGRILSNGKHLLGLINDILDLSKIEAGKLKLEMAPVALDDLIIETLSEFNGAMGGKQVVLRAAVPENLLPLETDAAKLKQVLINLVGNAIKFTERGSVIVSVTADPATRRAVGIDVRDTGIGIPAERLSAIFEPFEQAESGTSRRYGGTGLGLAISRSLSELMGYRLGVESRTGEGSNFRILLAPGQTVALASSAAVAERAVPAPTRGSGAAAEGRVDFLSKLVLAIDDETDARMLLTHYMEELGCRTLTASSGEQGLRMAREFRPDLITLDLLMPDMSGWEVLRALKADVEVCEIPVVIVSVVAEENRGNVLGAVDLLEKPIERGALLAMLRRQLRLEATGRALIVDGDADARELLTAYLGEQGIEVRTAANGNEALQALETFTPDLIVLDLLMPELDGRSLLHILRGNPAYRHIPVVVVTARDPSQEAIRSLSGEAILVKNAELEADLRAVIQTICRRGDSVSATPLGMPGEPQTV